MRQISTFRVSLGLACSAFALLAAGAAVGQTVPPTDPTAQVDAIVVTGSRVIRDGYSAPTPLAVVGAETLQQQATGNIAGLLANLPVFAGNTTPSRVSNSPSSGQTGLNLLNIRGLGASRSLVLLDGQRFVPTVTGPTSAVDISNIPQQLLARVETVTGGASAIYGSDAIGGVTNFVLDKTFTGTKLDVSGGLTSYGDDGNYRIEMSHGRKFAGGRGHLLLSGSIYSKDEVNKTTNRDWDTTNYCVTGNPAYTPTNGAPFQITVPNCGIAATLGGLINSGPLRGTAFGPGGTQYSYTYGSIVGSLMTGGDYRLSNVKQTNGLSLDPQEKRETAFARASYEVADGITLAYTVNWGHTYSRTQFANQFKDVPGLTIFSDNAYIPSNLRPALGGIPSFNYATYLGDLPLINTYNDRYILRNAVSLEGKADLFGSSWKWDVYYQHGLSRSSLNNPNNITANLTKAIDAVTNASGQIVCRVNRVTVTDPACKPFNVFGLSVNDKASIDYVLGVAHLTQSNTQQVWSGTITGEPFSTWAGPVSLALNAEHRKEKAYGSVNPIALANGYMTGNFKPINGAYSVSEAAAEMLIPLLRDAPLAKSLDLDLAGRVTDYSTSGTVETWKVGLTYTMVDDLRFRGYVSKDIRAGSLGELFAFGTAPVVTQNFNDPFTNTFPTVRNSVTGNPALTPEKADSYGFGVVIQPRMLQGLTTSIDYWNVKIRDAISQVGAQDLVRLCYSGNSAACAGVIRTGPANIPGAAGTPYAGQSFAIIDQVIGSYVNIAESQVSGIDWSASYRFRLDSLDLPGALALTWNQSFYLGADYSTGLLGSVTTHDDDYWRGIATATYTNHPWTVSLAGRFTSKNIWTYSTDPQTIECSSACPLRSTLPATTVTQDYVLRDAKPYFDASVAYDMTVRDIDLQLYLNIRNLFNEDPAMLPPLRQTNTYHQGAPGDDALGRIYRVGVRAKF